MKNIKVILLIICILCLKNIAAQPTCYFEHYSVEDGLPQFTITDMLQDHKGFMWFSTWDGFSKFDGNTFRNYKVRGGDIYHMKSNRIQHISEDKYGYIWLHSYDDEAHCFDPYTETFKELNSLQEYKNTPFNLSQIEIFPSGKVWLISKNNGCICVTDSLLSTQVYNLKKDRLKGDTINKIFEDKNLNSWILTNNGLSLVKSGQYESTSFFFENNSNTDNQSFYSATEFEDEIWFGSNNGRIWKYTKSTEKFKLFHAPTKSDIIDFQPISENELLISTSNDGFFAYHIRGNKFQHYNTSTAKELRSNKIRSLFVDSYKQFWFETEGLGIYKFDIETRKIKYYLVKIDDPAITSLPPASDIVQDIHKQIWVQPRGGGFSYYNRTLDQLVPFYNEESSPQWRFSNILHSLFSDRQGNLWFCTRSHGLEKVTFDNNNFKTFGINPNLRSPITNDVRAVLQTKDKNLWVATKDQHITIYDENYKRLGNFSNDGKISQNQSFSGIIYSMLQDGEGNIWLGTKTNGLFKIKQTNNPYQYQVEHFKKNSNDIYSISDNVVYSIYQDSKKNIWVGTYGNGLNLVKTTENGKTIFINHKNNLKNYPIKSGYRIRYISENKFGNIAVGTTTGLIMFPSDFSSPDDIQYKHYTRIPGNNKSLANNDIHGICNTKNGEMFLATFGGGLNKVIEYDSNGFPTKFRAYTTSDGLPTDVCLAVLEDENEKLWISMENNLSKFDVEKEEFETFAEIKRLMATNSFSEASATKLANNQLVFGFSNGILHFSPNEIVNSKFNPNIAFSDFRLQNQHVPIGVEESPLKKHIDDMNKLVLSHNQNSFSIGYAALDFRLTNNILYAYKLEGFDNDWIYVQKQRIANYTNLPKGEYVFKVKSTNSEGVWVDNERGLPIKILPSFWETPWAILIYVILSIAFVFFVTYILFIFYRLRKNVEMEKYLSEMKLRFFTDISHEIRTPLTMISAPVDYLLAEDDMPEKAKTHLASISQNANRMLRLVNQILDFRKLQQSQLKVQKVDIEKSVENVCRNFSEIAQKHKIQFNVENKAIEKEMWVAPDSFEIIMMNLLSNAFKYTSDEKAIKVTVTDNEKQFLIEIKDQGFGISKEKQKKLFTRFASFNEDPTKPSTGIGLSIVKDLIEKHGGKISLDSEVNKGSTFTLIFQKGTAHFDKSVELVTSTSNNEIEISPLVNDENSTGTTNKETVSEKEHSILVIEDNVELRKFIKTILEQDYTVIEADNGLEGLEKAEKDTPDFIVSDIMMPHMDGIELLQRLKENINTSHIPIVLLTAKTAIENKLESLTLGADDYITKPFSVQYFRTRINNLLEQRKRLQEAFRAQLTQHQGLELKLQPLSITSQDENLINNVIEIIEENIDNGEFTIDDLSTKIGMSRSVFSNKIKSLTGIPPFEFIRDIKLKKAAQMLASGSFMVKEVSFMIGISDTKHFGKIFKAKYGMTPQEYKTQNSKSE